MNWLKKSMLQLCATCGRLIRTVEAETDKTLPIDQNLSHGICVFCIKKYHPKQYDSFLASGVITPEQDAEVKREFGV